MNRLFSAFLFTVLVAVNSAAAEDKVHVHDFHSTILKLMGLDHEELSVTRNGFDLRLTELHGYHDVYDKLTGQKS